MKQPVMGPFQKSVTPLLCAMLASATALAEPVQMKDSSLFDSKFMGTEIHDGSSWINGWVQAGGVGVSTNVDGSIHLVNSGSDWIDGRLSTTDGGTTTWDTGNAGDWTIEYRIKFSAVPNGLGLWLGVDSDLVQVEIHDTNTKDTGGNVFDVTHGSNTDGSYHIYRVAHDSVANVYHVWRDGTRLSPPAGAGYDSTANEARMITGDWTGGTFGNGYVVDVAYIRYDQTGMYAPPAPPITTADFTSHMDITFDGYTKTAAVTNFPALVKLGESITGVYYDSFASGTGGDLRFVDAATNTLAYEIDEWDTNGTSYVWVLVPELASNATITAYWGNTNDTATPYYSTNGATWADSFSSVLHLNETAGTLTDASLNGHDQTIGGTVTRNVPGLVGGAMDYGLDGKSAAAFDDGWPTTAFTVSVWANRDVAWGTSGGQNTIYKNTSTTSGSGWMLGYNDAKPEIWMYDGAWTQTDPTYAPSIGDWHHYGVTYDGSAVKYYIDGELDATGTDGLTWGYLDYEGLASYGGGEFDGKIDELQVSTVIHSSNRVWACFMNQGSNEQFNTEGTVFGPPRIENMSAANVTDTTATVVGNLISTGGAATAVWVYWGKTDAGDDASAWQNTNSITPIDALGVVSNNLNSLSVGTDYYYRFFASNTYGTAWAAPTTNFHTTGVIEYTITASTDGNGSINPSGVAYIEQGSNSAVYTFSPAVGYHLTNVVADSTNSLGVVASYQFTNVQTNHTIQALFGINMYTITVTQAAGGAIAPDPPDEVPHGSDSQTFTFAPNAGYYLEDVIVDSVSQGPLASYQFTGVTANHDITAVFTTLPTPPVAADLVLWLDATGMGGSDGKSIDIWPDLSGETNNMAQATGTLQPTLYTNQVNGKAVARFDGGDGLNSAATGLIGDNSAYTKFIAVSFDTTSHAGNTIGSGASGAHALYLNSSDQPRLYHGGIRVTSTETVTAGQTHILSAWNDTSATELWVDGASGGTGTPGSFTDGTMQLGWFNTGSFLDGDVAEVLVYDRALTYPERNAVGRYLEQKYGLTTDYVATNSADVALTATVSESEPKQGHAITLTITAQNNGPDDATGLVITNSLPTNGVTYVSDDSTDFNDATGLWTIGDLAYSAGTTLTINVTVKTGIGEQTFTNTASIGAVTESDELPANDTASAVFTAWYDDVVPTDFARRLRIAFPGYNKAETLNDFPALVRLGSHIPQFGYDPFASTNGYDLRFTESNGTTIVRHETEEWNTGGVSHVWVSVPEFASNTTIWAYWGNAAAATPPTYTTNGSVWNDDYFLVLHLNDTNAVGRAPDSTSNDEDFDLVNSPSATTGKVAGGYDFASSYARSQAGNMIDPGTAYSAVSYYGWIKYTVGGGFTFSRQNAHTSYESGGQMRPFMDGSSSGNPWMGSGYNDGEWHHITYLNSGTQTRLYVDGVEASNSPYNETLTHFNSGRYSALGAGYDGNNNFNGMWDEFRIALTERSLNWAWACWMNQGSNDVFNSYATVEALPSIENRLVGNLQGTSADFNGYLNSTGGSPTTVTLFWGTNDALGAIGNWENTNAFGTVTSLGDLSTNITTLSESTKYYYRYHAGNSFGTSWAVPTTNFTTLAGNQYAITASSGPNGSIDPDGLEYVLQGNNSTSYTFAADTGYHLTNVVVDSTPIGVTNSYRFLNVTANHTIEALFGINVYTVTVTQAGGGSIAPAGPTLVDWNTHSPAYSIAPSNGYYTSDVEVDSGSIGATNSYQFLNVSNNHSLTATFLPYTDVGVSIAVDNAAPYAGNTVVFTVVATNGGPGGASGLTVDIPLPTGISYASHSGGSYAGGTWTIGALSAGSSQTLTINATVDADQAGDSHTIAASVSALTEPDNVAGNDSASIGIDVQFDATESKHFDKRIKIAFSGYTGTETLTNFPILVRLGTAIGGFSYADFASPLGRDLRFTDSDGETTIYHETEKWDVNGTSFVWVRVPELSPGGTDHIWAYYGNDENTSDVWPDALDGLQLWLDASDIDADNTPDSLGDGDPIGVWQDKSSRGIDANAASGVPAENPTYAAAPSGLNAPAIGLTGASQCYFRAGVQGNWNFLHDGSGCTVFVVYYDQTADLGTLYGTGGGGSANVGAHTGPRDSSDDGIYWSVAKGTGGDMFYVENHTAQSDGDFPKNAWGVYACTFTNAATPPPENEINVYNNGTSSFSVNSSKTPSSANSTHVLCLGSENNAFSLNGYLAEVIIYDRVLSNAEQNQVGHYLENKYGISTAYTDPTTEPTYMSDGSVWAADYEAVLHMKETSGTLGDATANGNTATVAGNPQRNADGIAGGAVDFDGSGDYAYTAAVNADFKTFSVWMKSSEITDAGPSSVMMSLTPSAGTPFIWLGPAVGAFPDETLTIGDGVGVTAINDTIPADWNLFHFVDNGTRYDIYMNGSPATDYVRDGGATLMSNVPVYLATRQSSASYYTGLLDEFRMATVSRSADWIKARYDSEKGSPTLTSMSGAIGPPPTLFIVK